MVRTLLVCAALAAAARAAEAPAAGFEQQLAAATASARVTVVHFWAPWCPNCRAELADGGWSGFIARNPDVNVVFVTIWNPADGRDVLEKSGVGAPWPNVDTIQFDGLLLVRSKRHKLPNRSPA